MPTETLLELLPDAPRWVEVRGMLLSGRGRVLGGALSPAPAAVVLQADTRLGAVVGRPAAGLIRELGRRAREILAPPEDAARTADSLPQWSAEEATLHTLPEGVRPPEVAAGSVRLLAPSELAAASGLSPALRGELEIESRAGTMIAASWADGRPVAFCYAGAVSETLWDVAVETLEPYRRQGHASSCAAFLIRRLARAGRRPVWGAAASNLASTRLAAKLGFVAADSLVVLSPGPRAAERLPRG